ncbi:D-arabinono-1,4-lactone oxidase [Oleiphilus messinensis]|uniref:D-arabinono-1,4-lactone oxidase n=1 Tax=Oleiphilus messinensis TaxID=141451 RepID=UPI0018DF18DC|nr:D-arabinono-1,4-lactone oxidase [Oleiphilus messinensis]
MTDSNSISRLAKGDIHLESTAFSEQAQVQPRRLWRNWSRSQSCQPRAFWVPTDEHELSNQLTRDKRPVRVVGAGHSFSPLVPTDNIILNMACFRGLVSVDHGRQIVTVKAGTPLSQLTTWLFEHGLALHNQGDIDTQTIAGAVSTGTHGTGITLGCLSEAVVGLRLVTAQGDILNCSEIENSALFRAAKVSLGSLGIFTELRLQVVPAYRLKEHVQLVPLSDLIEQIDSLKTQHRHVEFFAFPFADIAILKTLDFSSDAITALEDKSLSENAILRMACEASRWMPKLNPRIQKLVGRFVKDEQRVGYAHQIFPSPRNVRFNEMEYQVAAVDGPSCLEQIIQIMQSRKFNVFFPIEYRYVAGDQTPLSPFYGGDKASISVHQYYKQDYHPLFAAIEPIFHRYKGRPHWGKLHSLDSTQLRARYPEWDTFMSFRNLMDPDCRLLNPYSKRLLLG